MKYLKKILKQLKCDHHFIPQYQMFVHGGMDKVYVSQCRKCDKYQYKHLDKILKEGRKK